MANLETWVLVIDVVIIAAGLLMLFVTALGIAFWVEVNYDFRRSRFADFSYVLTALFCVGWIITLQQDPEYFCRIPLAEVALFDVYCSDSQFVTKFYIGQLVMMAIPLLYRSLAFMFAVLIVLCIMKFIDVISIYYLSVELGPVVAGAILTSLLFSLILGVAATSMVKKYPAGFLDRS